MGSKRNRNAGHSYERQICNELNELIPECEFRTTREMSRALDSKKIDVIDVLGSSVFSAQCKATTNLPDLKTNIFDWDVKNILFWKKTKRANKNMVSDGEYVIMTKKQFYDFIRGEND